MPHTVHCFLVGLCILYYVFAYEEDVYEIRLPAPSRRHHIAHFCPTLDIARECIRSCIPLGKPAFCGKDHVCYCGHRYSDSVKDEEIDPKESYNQFKDLYLKYFGPEFPEEKG
ncbi:hypothetical protein JYU34_004229 [Plutella xylostella]|uniref:Uncharacterized protein n=1 Tax=Plutella xylostella TaxID=51655 RepID=A0ABQ7QXG7_PLUXY|nr:hypothetical protein JYU34_004229 [Plutella xylostella]